MHSSARRPVPHEADLSPAAREFVREARACGGTRSTQEAYARALYMMERRLDRLLRPVVPVQPPAGRSAPEAEAGDAEIAEAVRAVQDAIGSDPARALAILLTCLNVKMEDVQAALHQLGKGASS